MPKAAEPGGNYKAAKFRTGAWTRRWEKNVTKKSLLAHRHKPKYRQPLQANEALLSRAIVGHYVRYEQRVVDLSASRVML